jgi:hypothetical protein
MPKMQVYQYRVECENNLIITFNSNASTVHEAMYELCVVNAIVPTKIVTHTKQIIDIYVPEKDLPAPDMDCLETELFTAINNKHFDHETEV